MPISPQRNGAPSVARPPYPVNATTLVPSRLSATRRSTAFERRLCRRNPVLGGGGEERAVRRATTVGRGVKPPAELPTDDQLGVALARQHLDRRPVVALGG